MDKYEAMNLLAELCPEERPQALRSEGIEATKVKREEETFHPGAQEGDRIVWKLWREGRLA